MAHAGCHIQQKCGRGRKFYCCVEESHGEGEWGRLGFMAKGVHQWWLRSDSKMGVGRHYG
eukprot:4159823-Prorocentrum_lima.AAC.1